MTENVGKNPLRNDQNTTESQRIVKSRWRKANTTVGSLVTKKSSSADRIYWCVCPTIYRTLGGKRPFHSSNFPYWVLVIWQCSGYPWHCNPSSTLFDRWPSQWGCTTQKMLNLKLVLVVFF